MFITIFGFLEVPVSIYVAINSFSLIKFMAGIMFCDYVATFVV